MAEYFQNIPQIYYDLVGSNKSFPVVASNITARARLLTNLNATVYYSYLVKEGETPESIADKYYGTSGRHWIVMLANNIVDPQYDWPLSYDAFNKYITGKYGSLETAQTTIHHYEKTITKTDSVTNNTTTQTFEIDKTAYDLLPDSLYETINLKNGSSVSIVITRSAIDCYTHETNENERKRTIKLVDKAYVNQLESELSAMFNRSGV